MLTFDPAKATDAYLATLSPEAHQKALHYTQGNHWLILWSTLVSIAISVIIIRLGWLDGLKAKLERDKPKPWLSALLVSGLYLVVSSVLSLPWDYYANYVREKAYGFTTQPVMGWLTEKAIGTGISVVFTAIFLACLYAFIRRAGKAWWAWAGGLTAVFTAIGLLLGPIYIQPLFNKYTPVPEGEVRSAIVEMAVAHNIPSDKIFIYDGSKQSSRYTANVSGLFGSARIAISDTMMAKGADMSEIRAVVAHEMGHYAHQHSLILVAIMSIMAMAAFWLADKCFVIFAKLLGAKDTHIANPANLAVLSVVLALLGVFATPIFNSAIRFVESDADAYSLQVAKEPDGLAKALVKTIEYRYASPSEIEEIIFYDHPSVKNRIRRAMDWKAAQETPAPVME